MPLDYMPACLERQGSAALSDPLSPLPQPQAIATSRGYYLDNMTSGTKGRSRVMGSTTHAWLAHNQLLQMVWDADHSSRCMNP